MNALTAQKLVELHTTLLGIGEMESLYAFLDFLQDITYKDTPAEAVERLHDIALFGAVM